MFAIPRWADWAVQSALKILACLRPINPIHWPILSRSLAAGHGWMPPMLMIAALGTMSGLNVAFGQLGLATWITWFVVGSLATWIVAARSGRNLFRFGPWGFTRPRCWFESARLLFIVTLFAALTLVLSFSLPRAGGLRLPGAARDLLYESGKWSAAGFFFAATAGYAISFVRRLPRRGQAFELVHYFYTIIGGLFLVTLAAIGWPPPAIWPAGVVTALLGVAGLSIFIGGFVTVIIRFERWDRRRKESAG
jgi:hypothetical protein